MNGLNIQKKLEENKVRHMLQALKGVEVRKIFDSNDTSAGPFREIYRQYTELWHAEGLAYLKIPHNSVWEEIESVILSHQILMAGRQYDFVIPGNSGTMIAVLSIQDVSQAARSLWYHEAFWGYNGYSPGFTLIDWQRNTLVDACSDSADEENDRVYTWDFSSMIKIGSR